ncbi:hypothetical protein ETAR_05200 [Edwardsiella tarda]|nr:hypothetical protein GBS0709_05120 [Edwardsiella tarda]
MAACTASRELSLAFGELLMTRETVATDTPASLATSLIVAMIGSIQLQVVNVYTSVAEKRSACKRVCAFERLIFA